MLYKTSIIIGYIVPKRIVKVAIIIKILFITSAETLLINNKFKVFDFFGSFNKKTKKPLKDQKVIDRIATIYEKQGSDCWFSDDPKIFLGEDYDPADYEKLNDIV